MIKYPDREQTSCWHDPIVAMARKNALSLCDFKRLLATGEIGPIAVTELVKANLLTPDQLIIWFDSYLTPDTREKQHYRPSSVIIDALRSQQLVDELTPDHLGRLMTINEQLLQRDLYGCDHVEYEAISHRLNRIRIDKGLMTTGVQYGKMPTARRIR